VSIVAALVAALVACGNGEPSSPAVQAASFRFGPAVLRIHAGETVVWHNADRTEHTVKGPDFFSRAIEPGRDWRHRFAKAGSYAYYCTLHAGMRGRVEVTAER
jgi:plastocyanin